MIRITLFSLLLLFLSNIVMAQAPDSVLAKSYQLFKVVKTDKSVFVGKIISQDAREVLIETQKTGQVIIPKHEISEITPIKDGEINVDGEFAYNESFATRYFITTNGFPLQKGEGYIQWNLFGPDIQYGITDKFGIGIMSGWVGMPIIASAKYSIKLSEDVNLGLGTLLGTGSWAAPDFGLALPFAALTLGDKTANLNISGGYGAVFIEGESDGRALFSVAGSFAVGKKLNFVFDSFIVPAEDETVAIIIPGIRWNQDQNKAFQFGFAGLFLGEELVPLPIPMLQWYRKL